MRRILVVDEKIENLNSMEKMIYEAEPDAWIVTFLQYTEALDFVRENPCDVLFVDLESAGIRGLLFAKAVKKFHRTINIIFQASTDDYANEAMQIRASGYMRGPVTSEKVMAELHELSSGCRHYSGRRKYDRRR